MSSIEKAMKARQELIASGMCLKRKTPMEKHKENPKSLRQAINAKCHECMGFDKSYRNEITNCTGYNCPLYFVRPYQKH